MASNFVIEVNSAGVIVWQYTGLSLPLDAERLSNGNTLIVNNLINSVIEVNSGGTTVWEYATGLWSPTDAERLSNGNTLITDQLNNRVIEVDSSGTIVWEITGLLGPKDAERLANGNTLIVEYSNNSVIEVDSSGTTVWSYTSGINNPNDAERIINQQPNAPTITGLTNGVVNVPYPYAILAEDPGGHTIYYWVEWGDDETDGWLGPYLSGTAAPTAHTWTTPGTYTIRAKVKDICGVESDWGELIVTMPRNKAIHTPFQKFLENHPYIFNIVQLLFQRFEI
jgi:hypothetical protein